MDAQYRETGRQVVRRPGTAAVSLWLCLRFHRLPLESLSRDEEQPVAVLAAQRVLRANDCAAALGIRPGMGAATVRALAGDTPLRLLERDAAAEAHRLEQLCCWAYGITPSLHSAHGDCLLLEIGGCLALFRGLDALLAAVAAAIARRGYRVRQGLAPTPKAAWLLSFADGDAALASHRPLPERLAPLPLTLLAGVTGSIDALRRAGLRTLGDVLALPPAALGRRCGRDFTRFLGQLLGHEADLHPDYRPPATFSDEYWFGYAVRGNAELLPAVQLLLESLCHFLRNTQLRTGEITWQLAGIDRRLREVRVRSGDSHSDWRHWYQLTRIHLEQLQLDGAVEGLSLHCGQLRPGQLEDIDLFSPRQQRESLAALLDRLRSRLGLQAVQQLGCRDEHLPELALRSGCDHPGDEGNAPPGSARPFWLLPEPLTLARRRGQLYWQGRLDLRGGPERIEDCWWQEAVSRDYYIASGGAGQYYWVFRDRRGGGWYLHGVFA